MSEMVLGFWRVAEDGCRSQLNHLPGETACLNFQLSSGERMDAPRALFLSVYGSKRPLSLPLLSLPLQTQFENGVHGDVGGVCHALFVVPQRRGQGRGAKEEWEGGREGGCKKKFAITLDRQKTFLTRPMHFSHDLALACFMSHVLCFALSHMMGPAATAPMLCELF